MITKTNIIITLQYEATHCWPNASSLPEVEYLKYPHRHIFFITCKKEVVSLDREIEIIMFKRDILNYLTETYKGAFGSMSCEMLCKNLLEKFNLTFCKVLEDNENGAEVSKCE